MPVVMEIHEHKEGKEEEYWPENIYNGGAASVRVCSAGVSIHCVWD